jgi:uncharacterized membrane protein
MEAFFIVVLGVAVFAVWRGGRDAVAQLRNQIESLDREIGGLRAQLAAHQKSHAAPPVPAQSAAAQAPAAVPPQPVPAPVRPAETQQPAAAAHAPAPPIAAFTLAATVPSATVQPTPSIQPPPPEQPKPWIPAPAAPRQFFDQQEPATEPSAAARFFSLEERLGANWLNKLGIAILVIGLAFFLALKLETWGPGGKVLCGFAVSLALLAGGVWLERMATYRIFARAGIGGGWALAFFTTFALHHIPAAHVLDSLAADLVLMLLVAAGMVGHSLRYRSQTVTGLAFLLGFATLLTSHLEAAEGTVVFSLTASLVLALALVVVTTVRHWAWLELAGLAAVYLSHLVWLTRVLPENHAAFADFWPSTILILLYWLIFRLAYVLRTPLDQSEENISSLSAVLNSTGVLGLLKLQSAHPEWAFWALAALGAVEMALAFRVRAKRRQAFIVLSTIATVLLVSAVPFRFHGVSWPVLWLVEAQVLAVCGLRLGEPVFRRLGLLAGVVTGGVLAFHDVVPLLLFRLGSPDPSRHWPLTAALALAAILYWVHAELYPRRWPQIAEDNREAFALRITSWLAVAAAATALWVALPDLWVPVGWLALVLVLAFAAHRVKGSMLALEADILGLAAAAVLVFHHIAPLALFRLDSPDPSHQPAETAVLALAAVAYWVRSEVFPRLLSRVDSGPAPASGLDFDLSAWTAAVLPITSLVGTAMAAAALWLVLPAPWVVVGWLALVVLLGLAADWIEAETVALQADLLAVAALAGLFAWNLFRVGHYWWSYEAPLAATVALLYAGMRRKTVLAGSGNYVAPAYSWAATLLLAFLAADLSADWFLIPVWSALGLALFELGRFARKGFLRWQGFFLVALAFLRYLAVDLPDTFGNFARQQLPALYADNFSLTKSLLLEVLVLAAAGYCLLERTREHCTRREHIVGLAADALGTLSIALWFAYRFPSSWVPVPGGEAWVTPIWAAMATILLALAWLMRRRAFLVQAVALVAAVLARAFFLDLLADSPAGFWHGPLFHLGVTALILLAALPVAFRLRREDRFAAATIELPADFDLLFRRPEQVFFFAAFALEVGSLAVKLSSGHITIAWSLLGLAVFLFALAVGERSFRLAGLALLLVSVVKILLMDVWKLSPSDRYTTLIVLGLALLAVSFLYTRFSGVIRRYL